VLPAWFTANRWHQVLNYKVDSNCVPSAVAAATGICGAATFTVSSNGILIGGAPSGGTMAMLGFNGVSTAYSNYQSTILSAAVQTQTQSP